MPARHPHKLFAPPIGTATPNAIYTQQAAKPACQQDIHTNFSHLLLAQLPRTQFTHSKPPNPHARKTSTQNFRSSHWHSYPKRNLHTPRRKTRTPGRHPHKIFAAPIGTATPNAIYTQQGAQPACQQDINAKFSQLLLAQLPRTQFTHSKPPNKHARKTTTQNFRISYCDSYPERNLHTARRQTRTQGRHQHKIFASPIVTATPSAIYTPPAGAPSPTPATRKQRQSSGDQGAPKRTSDPLQVLQVPRLPRESSGRAAETKERQSVHQTPCSAASPTPATRKQRQSSGDQGAPKRTSDPLQCSKPHACHAKAAAKQRRPRSAKAYIRPPAVQQVPRLPRESSGRAAETKERQSVHQTPCRCSKSHACHAKAAAEQRRPRSAKAYIRPPAGAASPTPATRKQRQSSGDQGAPKRTSDPVQVQQVPRLPRESSGRAAETKKRQSVHQTPAGAASPTPATRKQRQSSGDQGAPKRTPDPVQVQQVPRLPRENSGRAAETKSAKAYIRPPCRCSKSHACHAKAAAEHACHAKAAAEQRRPRSAKGYIRPPAVQQVPRLPRESSGRAAETKERQSVHQTPCSAASPTPATRKQRQSSGDQGAPKRTSDPLQVQQVPRLPRESSGRAEETKERQSVHQTPCRCSKSHACHAKAAAEQRRPRSAKAYIRPLAGAPSPTPATRKQRQSSGDQGAPKRTSDPLQVQQVPRLPRESSGRAAETKERQSVHQTPCSAASPTPATRKQRRPRSAKAYIRPRAVQQVPRLPRESSGRAAETKERQSVHQTPCRCSKSHACHAKAAAEQPKRTSDPVQCSKSHACHAKAAAEQRRPRSAKAYIRPRAVQQVPRLPRESSGRAAETKERQSVHQTPCLDDRLGYYLLIPTKHNLLTYPNLSS